MGKAAPLLGFLALASGCVLESQPLGPGNRGLEEVRVAVELLAPMAEWAAAEARGPVAPLEAPAQAGLQARPVAEEPAKSVTAPRLRKTTTATARAATQRRCGAARSTRTPGLGRVEQSPVRRLLRRLT